MKSIKLRLIVRLLAISSLSILLFYSLYKSINLHRTLIKKPLREGDIAPDFDLLDTNGRHVTLHNLNGKTVLLFFFSARCVECVDQFLLWYNIKQKFANQC